MTPQRRGIGVTIAAMVVVVVVIVGAIGYLSFTRQAPTFQPFQPNDFTLKGPVPLVTVTPQNNTFTLSYNATTLSSPVTALSFSLNLSWVGIYTNGTEWVPYSQACSSILGSSSSSDESVPSQASYSVSFFTVSGPCYNPPAPGWIPINGTAIDAYEQLTELNSSQVRLSVTPTAAPANQTVSLQFTITLNAKPGIYVIGLALGVQSTNAHGGFFEYSDLNPFPVIAKS
jgi:hypothetical protein